MVADLPEAEVGSRDMDALFVATDARDEEAVRSLVESARRERGRLDVMVNNAGVGTTERWLSSIAASSIATSA